jgi:ABC-type branched-subunit amino acid transport system ATPase component
MTALLEVEQLVKTFGGVRAVDDASLDVQALSITALIGPNGAGKSTLFNCVAGAFRPDDGRIRFDGRRIDRRRTDRIAGLGLVRTFQSARALTRMSVLDNVLLASFGHPGERLTGVLARPGAARRHERALRARADAVLELVGLERLRNAYAGTLSGGQRKLLDLARALMLEPKLVLLDEPTMGLEPRARHVIFETISALREQGQTVLLVEQNARAGLAAADHGAVLDGGRVALTGSGRALLDDPRTAELYLGGAAAA